jgi:chromosomal replication initiation ATPase DnaA
MNKIVNLPDFFSGSAEDIWNEAKAQLKLSMTKATFDTWLANSCGLSFDDHVLVVGVSNPYAQDWCTSRLMKIVERAVEAVMGEKVEVRFKVRHHENLSEKES